MSTTTDRPIDPADVAAVAAQGPTWLLRFRRWFGKNLIPIFAFLAFIYLFVPIAYTVDGRLLSSSEIHGSNAIPAAW